MRSESRFNVLISIINWNNYLATKACIDSILKNDYKSYKIVVLDNASVDNSYEQLVDCFSDIEIIRSQENLGFAGGHKYVWGIYGSEFDVIWLLNNDLVIDSNALFELVKSYGVHGEGVYGSLVLNPNKEVIFAGIEQAGFKIQSEGYSRWMNQPYDFVKLEIEDTQITGAHGCSFFIPKGVIDKIGFLDTSYFMYYEETAYNKLLFDNKVKSFLVSGSVVIHSDQGSMKKYEKVKAILLYYAARNYYRYKELNQGYCHIQYRNNLGGLIPLSKFGYYCLLYFFKKNIDYREKKYSLLGEWHFYLGKFGKTLDPNDYV